MTYQEALQALDLYRAHSGHPTTARIRALLARLGDPQNSCRCIHVAGTNGKGSVCAMLDAVLRAAGHRVGRFTSPSLHRFNDRITLDGAPISDEELAAYTARVLEALPLEGEQPNTFELLTAVAFLYFADRRAELVILEVGLGGRFDPTNVIDSSLLSVITEIDFDHTRELGNTIQRIAAEKAGIIKEHGDLLYGGRDDSAVRTVAGIAELRHARLHTVDRSRLSVKHTDLAGTTFDFLPLKGLRLSLLGLYQPQNAATALSAVELLAERGISIPETAVREGLATVRWEARFELLSDAAPILVFDGAHNAQGARLAVESVRTYFPEQRIHLLSGVMADKDYDAMVEVLRPIVDRAFTVRPNASPRALGAKEYAAHMRAHRIDATAADSVEEGLRQAIEAARRDGRPLLCLGSLYLYAPVCEALRTLLKK